MPCILSATSSTSWAEILPDMPFHFQVRGCFHGSPVSLVVLPFSIGPKQGIYLISSFFFVFNRH